ncbi:MAG: lysophospholipid acyltransferase family protein [Paludibacter sp.]
MIKGSQSKYWNLFFSLYVPFYIKRHFNEVIIDGKPNTDGKSVLILANHTSWWDGFLAFYLNQRMLKRTFWFMMLESELSKRSVLSKIGGFSVQPGSRTVFQSLQYAAGLLENPSNLVLIYPQGELNSMFEDNIVFKRGIEHFRISSESQSVLMLVQFIEYFAHEKPTVYLYLKLAVSDNGTLENINEQYQLFYNECLKFQKSKRV